LVIEDLTALLEKKGGRAYEGEGVTLLEHSLQTAYFAELSKAPPELVCAGLLHDIGHLLNDRGETPTLRGVDDEHQYAALPLLLKFFPQSVTEPVRLHVDAKRYLCATREGYHDALSADSQRSLVLQGGVLSGAEAARFIGQPHAEGAVKLRLWDDAAKVAGARTPGLAHFAPVLRAVALR
jgi:phosphonate degradation associated HDIG domain protein